MKRAVLILLLVIFVVVLFVRTKRSGYAPPRDENTVPPYIEPSKNYPEADDQSNVFMDAGGWTNMREHPMAVFLQGEAFEKGKGLGEFVGLESSSGDAPMYVITADEQYEYTGPSAIKSTQYIPDIKSESIPFIGGEQPAS